MATDCLKVSAWAESIKSAKKTLLVQDGRRKIHYSFLDDIEMAEEYDAKSNRLLARKLRSKNKLGGEGHWDFEVGEELMSRGSEGDLVESNSNYKKPEQVLHFEKWLRDIISKLKPLDETQGDCKTS